jgi:hypothetical protein
MDSPPDLKADEPGQFQPTSGAIGRDLDRFRPPPLFRHKDPHDTHRTGRTVLMREARYDLQDIAPTRLPRPSHFTLKGLSTDCTHALHPPPEPAHLTHQSLAPLCERLPFDFCCCWPCSRLVPSRLFFSRPMVLPRSDVLPRCHDSRGHTRLYVGSGVASARAAF